MFKSMKSRQNEPLPNISCNISIRKQSASIGARCKKLHSGPELQQPRAKNKQM